MQLIKNLITGGAGFIGSNLVKRLLDENEEVIFSDKKDDIELTDEINNARKKRRRSSANIE